MEALLKGTSPFHIEIVPRRIGVGLCWLTTPIVPFLAQSSAPESPGKTLELLRQQLNRVWYAHWGLAESLPSLPYPPRTCRVTIEFAIRTEDLPSRYRVCHTHRGLSESLPSLLYVPRTWRARSPPLLSAASVCRARTRARRRPPTGSGRSAGPAESPSSGARGTTGSRAWSNKKRSTNKWLNTEPTNGQTGSPAWRHKQTNKTQTNE